MRRVRCVRVAFCDFRDFRDFRIFRDFRDSLRRPNRTLRLFNTRSAVFKLVKIGALHASGFTATMALPGRLFVPWGKGGIFIEKALCI